MEMHEAIKNRLLYVTPHCLDRFAIDFEMPTRDCVLDHVTQGVEISQKMTKTLCGRGIRKHLLQDLRKKRKTLYRDRKRKSREHAKEAWSNDHEENEREQAPSRYILNAGKTGIFVIVERSKHDLEEEQTFPFVIVTYLRLGSGQKKALRKKKLKNPAPQQEKKAAPKKKKSKPKPLLESLHIKEKHLTIDPEIQSKFGNDATAILNECQITDKSLNRMTGEINIFLSHPMESFLLHSDVAKSWNLSIFRE